MLQGAHSALHPHRNGNHENAGALPIAPPLGAPPIFPPPQHPAHHHHHHPDLISPSSLPTSPAFSGVHFPTLDPFGSAAAAAAAAAAANSVFHFPPIPPISSSGAAHHPQKATTEGVGCAAPILSVSGPVHSTVGASGMTDSHRPEVARPPPNVLTPPPLPPAPPSTTQPLHAPMPHSLLHHHPSPRFPAQSTPTLTTQQVPSPIEQLIQSSSIILKRN